MLCLISIRQFIRCRLYFEEKKDKHAGIQVLNEFRSDLFFADRFPEQVTHSLREGTFSPWY